MTKEQKTQAIDQMMCHCRISIDSGEYEFLSARGTLYTLGFYGDECEEVLQTLFDGGFKNCLDPDYHNYGEDKRRISSDVCYWGADQLLSRLQSLWIKEA